MEKYVQIETKAEALLLINKDAVSMIRAQTKDGFPTCIIFFAGDESLELSANPQHANHISAVELDELLQQITESNGRY